MRHTRQIRLKEVGEKGQGKIESAAVLVIGSGGLGCPVLQYLVAAGVGKVVVVDQDVVSISNLQRQILFTEKNLGENKAFAAKANLENLNSEIEIVAIKENFNRENAETLLEGIDCVLDGSDNFSTKYLVNDACAMYNIPLVQGNIHQWNGQLGVYHIDGKGDLRDVFPKPPEEEPATCEEEGILGPVAGIIGSAMALEALKILLGIAKCHFSSYDGLQLEWLALEYQPVNREAIDYKKEDYDFYCATKEKWALAKNVLESRGGNYIQIDVREEYELENKKSGIIYIPLGDLKENPLSEKVGDKVPLFICGNAKRSKAAAQWYRDKFNTDAYYLKESL
jgi:adenylyltransferase/sulfurtransferase